MHSCEVPCTAHAPRIGHATQSCHPPDFGVGCAGLGRPQQRGSARHHWGGHAGALHLCIRAGGLPAHRPNAHARRRYMHLQEVGSGSWRDMRARPARVRMQRGGALPLARRSWKTMPANRPRRWQPLQCGASGSGHQQQPGARGQEERRLVLAGYSMWMPHQQQHCPLGRRQGRMGWCLYSAPHFLLPPPTRRFGCAAFESRPPPLPTSCCRRCSAHGAAVAGGLRAGQAGRGGPSLLNMAAAGRQAVRQHQQLPAAGHSQAGAHNADACLRSAKGAAVAAPARQWAACSLDSPGHPAACIRLSPARTVWPHSA